jgi:hypothetical protein
MIGKEGKSQTYGRENMAQIFELKTSIVMVAYLKAESSLAIARFVR